MKVVVTGEGKVTVDDLTDAFNHHNITPTVIMSPSETEVEATAEQWAAKNSVKVDSRKPKWGDMTVEKCTPRDGKFGPYNARAAFNRNDELAADCDCVVMVLNDSRSSASIVEAAEKAGKDVYVWPLVEDADVPF